MSDKHVAEGGKGNTDELFKGLKALSDASFPKRCANCGAKYASAEEYVKNTESISGQSGLKTSFDDDDSPIVELFRNCVCGSTLMDCFNDRRDISQTGLKRRQLFGKLMDMLVDKGMVAQVARKELINLLKGEKSELLEQMGINTQVR